ncbi:unnamed protein product, partial [Brassica oleracea]
FFILCFSHNIILFCRYSFPRLYLRHQDYEKSNTLKNLSIYIKICLLHSCASTSAPGQKVEVCSAATCPGIKKRSVSLTSSYWASLFYMLLGCDKKSVTGRISLSFANPNMTTVKNGDAS